jgi:hypothetical protein
MSMPEYAGRDLSPLPFESSLSQIGRIVSLNEMSGAAFLRLTGLDDRYRKWDVANGQSVPEEIAAVMQWRYIDPGLPRKYHNVFDLPCRSAPLRVCDECIGSMYHSFWHQCWIVSECPLHGARLRNVCLFCDQPYGPYTLSHVVANRFLCKNCGSSLSSEPATIARHLQIRAGASRFSAAFLGVHQQLLRLLIATRPLWDQQTHFPFGKVGKWWPDKSPYWDVLHDVGNAYLEKARASPEMTWLVWPSAHSHIFRDYSEVDLAYTETIDSLRRWLTQRHPYLLAAGERPELLDVDGFPRTDLWPPEFLAFMLLRYHVEIGATSWGVSNGTTGVLRTSRERFVYPWLGNAERPKGFARSEWVQAMVFGRFAAIYWAARTGTLAGKKFEADDYVVPCFWSKRNWEPDVAAVVFPPIEGMPLGRFSPSPLRLYDAVDLLRRDCISTRRELIAIRRGDGRLSAPRSEDHGT